MAQHSPTIPRSSPAPSVDLGPSRVMVLGHALIGLLVGAGMGSLVVGNLAEFGSHAPLVQRMLALGAPGGSTSLQAVAVDSGSQLLEFGALALAIGSALALFLGAGAGLLNRDRGGAAYRAVRIGLWMALAVCLLALLPLEGAPFALGYTRPDLAGPPAALQWHPALQVLAAAAAGGLLLSAVGFRRGARRASRQS